MFIIIIIVKNAMNRLIKKIFYITKLQIVIRDVKRELENR